MRRRRQTEHLVARHYNGVALGQQSLTVAIDRGDTHFDVGQVMTQRLEWMAHQWPALEGTHPDQAERTFGELQYLQGFRKGNQALDVIRDDLLGTDREIHREIVRPEQFRMLAELA